MFQKAERRKAKLRLALSGPSGSGKTYGALLIAKGIGGRVAVLDTERGSASLYADMLDFDVVNLDPPYEPERYVEVIRAAEQAGYDTLVIDSITHEWKGQGGMLEIVDAIARAKFRGNSYAAWNEGDKRHRKFVDAMLHSKMHIIATMRSKAVYVESERNGKKTIEKQGAAPEQRDGIEYEFTCVLDLHCDGNLAVRSKDRTKLFPDPFQITEDTGRAFVRWLECGAEAPKPLDLDAVAAAFAAANTQDELDAAIKSFGLTKEHPLAAHVSALYRTRHAALAAITDDQRVAIQAAYNGWDRDERLADIAAIVGRTIASVNDLTKAEASTVIDRVHNREAA